MLEVYAPKPGDEKKFFDKHKVEKHKNLGGKATEDDKVFQATNVKAVDREKEHGYNPDGSDEKVYESFVIEASDEDFAAKLADAYQDMKDHPQAGPHIKKAKKAMQGGDSESAYEHMKMAIKASRMNEETEQVEEGIEDRLEAARERAKAAGKTIKQPEAKKPLKRFVAGKAYGGSKQKEDPEDVKEEDMLSKREGLNSPNKTPRKGQTDFRNIPLGNRSDVNRPDYAAQMAAARKKQPSQLKTAIKNTLGKHTKPKLPEQFEINQTNLEESKGAEELYKMHHARVKDLLKKISAGVDAHKAACMKGQCHYGHAGDMKHYANNLQDIHDSIHMQGEYAAPHTVKEDVEQVDEKKLTSAEMKKREEVAKAIERENPNMPMAKKMAIATATAKKVAEEKEPVGIQLHFQHPETMKTSKEVVFSARHAAQREKEMKKAGYETVKRKLYYGK